MQETKQPGSSLQGEQANGLASRRYPARDPGQRGPKGRWAEGSESLLMRHLKHVRQRAQLTGQCSGPSCKLVKRHPGMAGSIRESQGIEKKANVV